MSSTALVPSKVAEPPGQEGGTMAIDHICFLKLPIENDNVLWPALLFDSFAAMKAFLERRAIIPKGEIASLSFKFFLDAMAQRRGNDPVAFLCGSNNPTGRRLMFSPANVEDFFMHLVKVSEGAEGDLKDALDMVEIVLYMDNKSDSPSDTASVSADTSKETESTTVDNSKELKATDQTSSEAQEAAKQPEASSAVAKSTDETEATEAMTVDSSQESESVTLDSSQDSESMTVDSSKESESMTVDSSKESESMTVDSSQETKDADEASSEAEESPPQQAPGTKQAKAAAGEAEETMSFVGSPSDESRTVSEHDETPVQPKGKRTQPIKVNVPAKKAKKDKNPKAKGGKSEKAAVAPRPAAEKKTTKAAIRRKGTAAAKKRTDKRKVPDSVAQDSGPKRSRKRSKSVPAKAASRRSSPRNNVRNFGRPVKKEPVAKTPKPSLEISPEASPELSVASFSDIMPAKLPKFEDVRPLLMKVGFKFHNGRISLPGVDPSKDKYVLDRDYFENGSRLRRYLCAYGTDCKRYEWSQEEEELLLLWVRTAIVPGLWGLEGEVPQHLQQFLKQRRIHPFLMRLGFKWTNDGFYYLPGEKPRVIGGLSINGRKMLGDEGLLVYLARFGLPQACKFDMLTEDERIHFEYYISQSVEVDAFVSIKPDDSDPPLFCDGDSDEPSENSRNGGAAPAQERNGVASLQTQNASPTSGRSVAGATQVTDSTDGEKDQASPQGTMTVGEQSRDSEFGPTNDDASAESQSPLEGGRKEQMFPITQPECDSSTGSVENPSPADESIQNCATKDTKSTTEFVGQACEAAADDMFSPKQPRQLFRSGSTPDSDDGENDAAQVPTEDDRTKRGLGVFEAGGASPTDPKLQEDINDMLFDDQGAPGSDSLSNMIYGDSSPKDSSTCQTETNEARSKADAAQEASPASVGRGSEEGTTSSAQKTPEGISAEKTPNEMGLDEGKQMASDGSKVASVAKAVIENGQVPVSPIVKYPIGRNDDWNVVESKMIFSGWTHANGRDLVTDFWIPPHGKLPSAGGIVDQDYVEEKFGMKMYAYKHLGWGGDDAFHKEVEELQSRNSPDGTRPSRRATRHATKEGDAKPSSGKSSKPSKASATKRTANERSTPPPAKKAIVRESASKKKATKLRAGHPELKKSVGAKLRACQEVLGTAFGLKTLSAADGEEETQFQRNIDGLSTFLREVVGSEGAHGRVAGEPACLYVCGAPGVGKTSSVKWAIKETEKWASEQGNMLAPSFCFVNAAAEIMSPKFISEKIADALSIKSKTQEQVKKALDSSRRSGKSTSNCSCLVLVIDEIELLLSEKATTSDKPSSSAEATLKMLGEWSTAKNFRFALIGISNSIGNQQAKRLQRFGLAHNTITFSPYSKDDLIRIVEDRVGDKIIERKAIEFAASKVAASSGDARKVLELTSSAVALRMKSLKAEEGKERNMDKPVVSVKFMLTASRATNQQLADTIDGLPQMAKTLLCVAVSLNQVGKVSDSLTLGMLKRYTFEALASDMYDEDLQSLDVFKGLAQHLFDAGLLLSGTDEPFDVSHQDVTSLQTMPIRLGVQLYDVESALEQTLGEQEVYRGIMQRAKNAKL